MSLSPSSVSGFQAMPLTIAAALAYQHQGNIPLLLKEDPKPKRAVKEMRFERTERSSHKCEKRGKSRRLRVGMERYRIELGNTHGAQLNNKYVSTGSVSENPVVDPRASGFLTGKEGEAGDIAPYRRCSRTK